MRFLLLTISLFIIRIGGFAQNIEFRSLTTFAQDMSDIWGYSDGEFEYALASTASFFTIVDVTDPDNPVELHHVDGPNTFWRDIKTWEDYAYGIHENTGGSSQGLIIMDLADLQNDMPVTFWENDGTLNTNFRAAHNIFIDEFGYAYICGHNFGGGGVLILDLNQDPLNPTVVGEFTNNYVHDCFVRDNILYTSDENSGTFTIVDVSDKSNLVILATEGTPGNTSHNNWLSDDSQTLFTTDENSGAYLASYDISDLNDIVELDRYRSSPGMNVIPHNVFIRDDFAIISYYRDGIKILDVSQPDNMIEVGGYDTSPNYTGNGFNGAWGVYPYLPSGNILVSDIEEGLYVLTPDYKRATHIKGKVVEVSTQNPIFGATVSISSDAISDNLNTNLSGKFSDGFIGSGNYTINVSKSGYLPYSNAYDLEAGDLLELFIELESVSAVNEDTVYTSLPPFQSSTVCDINATSINADTAYTCDGSANSFYGNWTVTNDGCLTYNANSASGIFVDSICFVSENTSTGAFNINVAIVSVGTTTATTTNVLENGTISLIENPVQSHIRLRNDIQVRAPMQFKLYDVSGQLVTSIENNGDANISIPVEHLNSGIYVLEIQSEKSLIGWAKVLKK